MKFNSSILFFILEFSALLALVLAPYNESKVGMHRLEQILRADRNLKEQVYGNCSNILPTYNTQEERFFVGLYPSLPTFPEPRNCRLRIESMKYSHFGLITNRSYAIRLSTENTSVPVLVYEKTASVQCPRPLCFLPFVLFILGLLFGFTAWNLTWTLVSYIFLLSGANLIQAVSLSARSAFLALTTDKTLLGLALVVVWLSLVKSRKPGLPAVRSTTSKIENNFNRGLSGLIGLWSPAFFTLMGNLLFPIHTGIKRMRPFLDGQLFISLLSLYFLSMDFKASRDFIESSFLLPRYFSFTAILFLFFTYGYGRPRKQVMITRLPYFKRSLTSVIAIETLGYFVPILKVFPTLTRIGFALVLAELSTHSKIDLKVFWSNLKKPLFVIFLASFLSIISVESGLIDLALVLWEPQVHPSSIVIFTFVAGIALGFLTGSFSTTFFALFAVLMKSYHMPLIRAALLDGIVAGSLLSPFSIYNLLPCVQFDVKIQELIAFRFKQLSVPLLIGSIIYTVSAINSVAILRPVTFIFLCLFVIGVQLKKANYKIGRFWSIFPDDMSLQAPHSDPH